MITTFPNWLWFRLERIFQSIKLSRKRASSSPSFRLERIFQSIKLVFVQMNKRQLFRLERIFQSIKLIPRYVIPLK